MTSLGATLAAEIRAAKAKVRPALKFRGGPLEVQTTLAREWCLEGAADTTKTTAGLWRLDSDLRRTPKARAAITMRLRANMDTTVLLTWARIIARRGGVTVFGGERPQWYDYPNGARCFVAGLDDGDKVLGGEFDFVYGSQLEQWAVDSWEKLSTRVTGRGAVTQDPWLGGDCNPGPSKHWIRERARLRLFHARHEDNPELFDDAGRPTAAYPERMAPLDALTGVRLERLRYGRWVSAEGVVYEDFSRDLHVRPACEAPPFARYVGGVDWGYTNPGTLQVWGIDGDGRMWLVEEHYHTRKSIEWWTARAKAAMQRRQMETIQCDPSEPGFIDAFRDAGLPATGAKNAVALGIQAVQKRLRPAGDGRPRLVLLDDACSTRDEALEAAHRPACTADEFEVYAWEKDATGKPTKERPVKANDHGCDPMRYVALYLEDPVATGSLRTFSRPERLMGVL